MQDFITNLRNLFGAILEDQERKRLKHQKEMEEYWKRRSAIYLIPTDTDDMEPETLIPTVPVERPYSSKPRTQEEVTIDPTPEVMTPDQVAEMWDEGKRRDEEKQQPNFPVFMATLRSLFPLKKG